MKRSPLKVKRLSRLWVFAGFAFALALGQPRLWREALGGKPAPRVAWATSLVQAKKRAARENKPLLIVFTAAWCGPCQEMEAATWQDSSVAVLANTRFVPVLLDIDREAKQAQHYGALSIPYVVVQDAQREEIVSDASGCYGPPAFLRFAQDALSEAAHPKATHRTVGRAENFPALPPLFGL